jgi:tetratricopeptide (TPR) repeat protein
MRMVQWIPILAVMTGFGIHYFLSRLPAGARTGAVVLLFALAIPLDLFHLFQVYPSDWPKNHRQYMEHRSVEFSRAYPLLEAAAKEKGSGWILLNSHPDPYDQTLYLATYRFNSAANPRLDPAGAQWAAILTNVHEEPFLKRSFPGATWTWLSEGLDRQDGGMMLEIIPLQADEKDRLAAWLKADRALKELTYRVMQKGVTGEQAGMLAVLEKAYPLFEGDRLLGSRYWRIMALHRLAGGDRVGAIRDEQKAVERGYPMAHLYNEMGCLLFQEHRVKEAERAFRKALTLKPNCTNAASNLEGLLSRKTP